MNRRWSLPLLALAVALLACDRPVTPPPPPAADPVGPPAEDIAAEKKNLLNMAYGATVISRTAELTLGASPALTIDGHPETGWVSPPADTRQTLVLALPARARIDEVGLQTPAARHLEVRGALFEGSLDGVTFRRLYEPKFDSQRSPQLVAVEPAEAKYVRVTTTDAPGRFARINAIHVRGSLLDAPVRGPLSGCWTVNGLAARFDEHDGGRITGTIEEHGTVSLEGGADGMVYRLAWLRGPERGVAAITVSDDGKHLTGLEWHEEARVNTFSTSWFGERKPCPSQPPAPDEIASEFLTRRSFPLYSENAATVSALLAQSPARRFRLVAHEYRADSVATNRQRAQAELDALRDALQKSGADLSHVQFIASGSDQPRKLAASELMRALYSFVAIERR